MLSFVAQISSQFCYSAVLSALIASGVSAAASAAPIVYEVHRTISNGGDCGAFPQPPCVTYTLDGTITTDGTLGAWGFTDHMTDIDLILSDGTLSAHLTGSSYEANGSGILFATSDLLQYGYGFSFGFFDESDPSSLWAFCTTQRANCWEFVRLSANGTQIEMPIGPQPEELETIGQVPEPATALSLAVGLVLMARWRARSQRTIAR